MNTQLIESPILTDRFDLVPVPIQLSTRIDEIGGFAPRKLWALARNIGGTMGALWARRPDLIYFTLPPHGGGFYSALPLILLAKLRGAPVVYHFHGKGIRAAAKRSGLFRALFGWATRGAHHILLSARLYDDAADFMARETTVFIPNFGPRLSSSAAIEGRSGRHILFLSNLVQSKGPIELLDALAHLMERGYRFQATFAGSARPPLSAEAFAAEAKARGLEQQARYVGPIYGAAKRELLESADILALPTLNDAFPLVVLEAMAAGVPVVATAEGAIPDMVEDGVTGFLVRHHDADGLADALEKLLADPDLRRRFGAAAQARVASQFSREQFFDRLITVWDRLIRARHLHVHSTAARRQQP